MYPSTWEKNWRQSLEGLDGQAEHILQTLLQTHADKEDTAFQVWAKLLTDGPITSPPPPDQQTKCHNTPAYNTWLLLQLWPTKNTHTHTKGEPSSWSGWRWGCSRGGVEVPGELVSGICIFSDSAAVWSLSESMSTAVGVFRLEPAYSLIGVPIIIGDRAQRSLWHFYNK